MQKINKKVEKSAGLLSYSDKTDSFQPKADIIENRLVRLEKAFKQYLMRFKQTELENESSNVSEENVKETAEKEIYEHLGISDDAEFIDASKVLQDLEQIKSAVKETIPIYSSELCNLFLEEKEEQENYKNVVINSVINALKPDLKQIESHGRKILHRIKQKSI